MEADKNIAFIDSLDLSKFTCVQSRKHPHSVNTIEQRNIIQRSYLTQINFVYPFTSQTLVTHIQIQSENTELFDQYFQSVQIEASSLVHRGHYSQFINMNNIRDQNRITINGSAFTHTLKIIILIRNDGKKKTKDQKQLYQEINKKINQTVKEINLYGITINSVPVPALLTKLLNISHSFRKFQMLYEAIQTQLLAALCLISARRFVQASELLRKVSKFYVQKYNASKSTMDFNRSYEKSWIKQIQQDPIMLSFNNIKNNFSSGRILQGNKFLLKAAKVQLLLAQTISHPSLFVEKLQAYNKCNSYFNGNPSPQNLSPDADLEDVCSRLSPQIIPFFIKILTDKLEPYRVAALKSIEFFIETLGCYISTNFLLVLKQVIATYPNNTVPQLSVVPYGLIQMEKQYKNTEVNQTSNNQNSTRNKTIIDHYHHLLETLLSIINQINRKFLHPIFTQIISPGILSKTNAFQLKLYLVRFAQRILTISGADIPIQPSFVGAILSFCQQKSNGIKSRPKSGKNSRYDRIASASKHVLYNLVFFSHKILTLLKTKVFPRYSGPKIQGILSWINKTLIYLGENQLLSNNSQHLLFVFNAVLDFVNALYSHTTGLMNHQYQQAKIQFNPLESIIYFANISLHQNGLPFQKILNCLTTLLRFFISKNQEMSLDFQVNKQIINRILNKSRESNLALKELQVLGKVLEITQTEQAVQWLQNFLYCIPHSTFDQTYWIFSMLIQKSAKYIQNQRYNRKKIYKDIIKTLLDQYTVKGKAFQQAKQSMILFLIKQSKSNALQLLQICLFENNEPKPQNYTRQYRSKVKNNRQRLTKMNKAQQCQHRFDSKTFKIDYQAFIQKLLIAQLILTKIKTQKEKQNLQINLLSSQLIKNYFNCIQTLSKSNSWKVKNRTLSLMNIFIEITTQDKSFDEKNIFQYSLIIKQALNFLKRYLLIAKQSKIMYNVLYNYINFFKCFDTHYKCSSQINIEEVFPKFQKALESNEKGQEKDLKIEKKLLKNRQWGQLLRLYQTKQFIKQWHLINPLLYSPWQSIKQIYISLIIEVFKNGLSFYPESLKKKCLQMAKPLIFRLLVSNQHNQRLSGVKIFGCFLGLGATCQMKIEQISNLLSSNILLLKNMIERIVELNDDWNQTTSKISKSICQITLTKQQMATIKKKAKIQKQMHHSAIYNSFHYFNLGNQLNDQHKNYSCIGSGIPILDINSNLNNSRNLESLLNIHEDEQIQHEYFPAEEIHTKIQINEDSISKISQFRSLIQKDVLSKTQNFQEKQSFVQLNEQQFYDFGYEKAESVEGKDIASEDEQLEFQDLGIIQLDDQQEGDQQENQAQFIQKLPIKKIYKLSPSVISSSKPQRIRSKRYHPDQFQYRQNIIVDQLEDKTLGSQNITANKWSHSQQTQKNINTLQHSSNKNPYKIQKSSVFQDSDKDQSQLIFSRQDKKQQNQMQSEIEKNMEKQINIIQRMKEIRNQDLIYKKQDYSRKNQILKYDNDKFPQFQEEIFNKKQQNPRINRFIGSVGKIEDHQNLNNSKKTSKKNSRKRKSSSGK